MPCVQRTDAPSSPSGNEMFREKILDLPPIALIGMILQSLVLLHEVTRRLSQFEQMLDAKDCQRVSFANLLLETFGFFTKRKYRSTASCSSLDFDQVGTSRSQGQNQLAVPQDRQLTSRSTA